MQREFPILEIIPQLKAALDKQPVVILQAPPGAGKSTILPLQLLEEPWLRGKKMIMLEPRRLAAKSVSLRMAELLEQEAGRTVGYRVRFEKQVSSATRIEVVTEGILTRMMQNDNALEDTALVIFDEFHERSLNADLALALCTQVQQVMRPDLRILIMSATLETGAISALFNGAPVISSAGRQHPIKILYEERDEKEPLQVSVARTVRKALKAQDGDILVFLPGAAEIQRTQELLENEHSGVRVLPLYGDLPSQKQQQALAPDPGGLRKIVLATSVAETSLTIEGVTIVIDSGLSRVPRFDPRSGLTRLETVRVTRDAADQRAGRAGRLAPGICFRMWSEGSQIHLIPSRNPEIMEADLAPMVLELSEWGIRDVNELNWLTAPPSGTVKQARELLMQLDAIDERGITQRGKKMLRFPTHPRIAHLLIEAQEWETSDPQGFPALAADLAALLEERDPLQKEAGTDIALRVEALRKWRGGEYVVAERRVLERIERLSASWRKLLSAKVSNDAPSSYGTGRLIAAAYPERVAGKVAKNSNRYRLANGRFARIPEHDVLGHEDYIAIALMDAGAAEGRVFMAAALDKKDLYAIARQREVLRWDEEREMVVAASEKFTGSIVLESKPLSKFDSNEKDRLLISIIREKGLRFAGWDDEAVSLQARLMCVRAWRPAEQWPDVSDEALLAGLEVWLLPYLSSITKRSELQKLDYRAILLSSIPYELAVRLDKIAPSKIEVPTGSMIRLDYFPESGKVEMSVRLQEMFGMLDTPRVNEGKVPVLLHLLSPGYKPVQVTTDLRSFWSKTYFEVRKELLGRYPKHHWPLDPLTAEPMRGPKKRK